MTMPLSSDDRQSDARPRKNRLPGGPTQKPFTDDERKMLRGRPTHYRPEHSQLVIEDMCDGYSFGGFAGKIGVGRSTINEWKALHPEFAEACSRAEAVRQRYWESILLHVAETGGQGSQGQVAIFGAINAGKDDWKQKQEIEHTGQITLAALVESSMKAIAERSSVIDGQTVDITDETQSDFFD